MQMPQSIKDKWVAALRSGEYKQGQRFLCDDTTGSYCCLGVLEVITDGEVERNSDGESRGLPTQEFYDRYDITGWEGTSEELWLMNDAVYGGDPHTFDEIAGWIEDNVKGFA